MAPTKVFSGECCKFFKNSFSIEHIQRLLLCLLEREEEESMEQRSEGKFFKWKKKWKHFIIQLRKYYNCSPFSLTFSSTFFSFDSCVLIFCVFISDKLKNISCRIYSEAGIKSYSVKQLFGKINQNRYFFYKKFSVQFTNLESL